jgi:hemolysin activation/secretion protein
MGLTAQRALLSPGATAAEEKVSGVRFVLDGFYAPRTWDASSGFGGIDGSLSGFLGNQTLALALRSGGRVTWGRYPWFEAASIGGGDNVRGWDSQRFRGDSSLYGNAELRYWLGKRKAPVLPLRWGLFSYAEGGRVWLEGESSDSWHKGAGVGLMTQLIGVPLALSGSMAWGDHDKGISFYVKGGYSF